MSRGIFAIFLNICEKKSCKLTAVLFVFLTACNSSTPDSMVKQAVKQQVNKISAHLPIKEGFFNFILAQSFDTTIVLTFVHEYLPKEGGGISEKFLNAYQENICSDASIRNLLNKKVSYDIIINDMEQRTIKQRKIDSKVCSNDRKAI